MPEPIVMTLGMKTMPYEALSQRTSQIPPSGNTFQIPDVKVKSLILSKHYFYAHGTTKSNLTGIFRIYRKKLRHQNTVNI
jgi:hypothetical protein